MPMPDTVSHPHITLRLPDGSSLRAVAYAGENNPAINLYLLKDNQPAELVFFAEINPERSHCHERCIGAYQSNRDETTYYAPYRAERIQYDRTEEDGEN